MMNGLDKKITYCLKHDHWNMKPELQPLQSVMLNVPLMSLVTCHGVEFMRQQENWTDRQHRLDVRQGYPVMMRVEEY